MIISVVALLGRHFAKAGIAGCSVQMLDVAASMSLLSVLYLSLCSSLNNNTSASLDVSSSKMCSCSSALELKRECGAPRIEKGKLDPKEAHIKNHDKT